VNDIKACMPAAGSSTTVIVMMPAARAIIRHAERSSS
jgi:hypothetical protein